MAWKVEGDGRPGLSAKTHAAGSVSPPGQRPMTEQVSGGDAAHLAMKAAVGCGLAARVGCALCAPGRRYGACATRGWGRVQSLLGTGLRCMVGIDSRADQSGGRAYQQMLVARAVCAN
jgi:hypothetical protein